MNDAKDIDPQHVRDLLASDHKQEAVAYINRWIDQGSVRAMIAMADYLFDCGDRDGSLYWMRRAESAVGVDDLISPIYLASAYERGLGHGDRPEREQKALALLERVGEAGNVRVIYALMTNYLYGLNGAPKDRERFIYWTQKAAALGSDVAAQVLRSEGLPVPDGKESSV